MSIKKNQVYSIFAR